MAARRKRPPLETMVRDLVDITLAQPGAHLDRAVAALALSQAAERYARAEVLAARELDGSSWADVGAALGVSRQTAHERFRTGPDGMHSRAFKRNS
ncbi:MAG: hypothetical protein ACRD1K_17950 [Acidimicrobiales bacterium]